MAKPVTEEELQLRKRARRRLVGAVALVAVTAAVLPMVLDTDPKPTSSEVNIQIPSPDAKMAPPGKNDKSSAAAKSDKKQAPENKADAKSEAGQATPAAKDDKPAETAAAVPAEEKAPAKTVEKPAEKVADKPAEKAAEKTIKPGAGTFYIQIAALAEADKAKAMQQRIIDAGVRAYTVTATVKIGRAHV